MSRKHQGAFVVAALFFVLLRFLDLGVSDQATGLSAVFIAVVILWVSEALPIAVTALMIPPLLVVSGVCGAKEAFAPLAHPLLYLFVGGFMLSKAMVRHGLDRRIVRWLLSKPAINKSALGTAAAFVVLAMILSAWVSNTATCAILLPILLGLSGGQASKNFSNPILAVAYTCSLGGLMTPVGSPPNLIAIGFLEESGIDFTFFDWMLVGIPVSLVLCIVTFLFFRKGWVDALSKVEFSSSAPQQPEAWSKGEKWTALAFGFAVLGWMGPGVVSFFDPLLYKRVSALLPSGVVALCAAALLFVGRDEEGELVLPWSAAATIDWGIIILFGGGISLGVQMMKTGLAEQVANTVVEMTGLSGGWSLVFVAIAFTIFFTEVCSNTATSNMLSPLVLSLAKTLGVSPIPSLLAVALAASCAFMLPIATGPNAIAYGTGGVTQGEMIRKGFLLNLVAIAVIWVMLRILCPIFGWSG